MQLLGYVDNVNKWTIAIIGFEQEEVVAGSDLGGRALQAGASAHLLSIWPSSPLTIILDLHQLDCCLNFPI